MKVGIEVTVGEYVGFGEGGNDGPLLAVGTVLTDGFALGRVDNEGG